MITEHDLKEAIAECEGQRNPSVNTCMKLAAFYTIKDKMYPVKQEQESKPSYTYMRSMEYSNAESEFKKLASGMSQEELIDIMDELLSTVNIIAPKLYAGVMRKIRRQ